MIRKWCTLTRLLFPCYKGIEEETYVITNYVSIKTITTGIVANQMHDGAQLMSNMDIGNPISIQFVANQML